MTFDLGLDGNVRPDDGGCERVMVVEDEFEDLERAPASVRSGFLGERDRHIARTVLGAWSVSVALRIWIHTEREERL